MTFGYSRMFGTFPKALLGFVVALLLVGMAFAQDPQPTASPTPESTPEEVTNTSKPFTLRTDLVTLTLTVTDLYGRYVSGLSKKAFTVFDNNKEQDITYFSDSDAPVSVGILFDVSGSMSGEKINKARKALERFVATSHPSDEYFLIAFNNRAQLLLDKTRDGEAVLRKLTLVEPKRNTALYDAVYLGVDRVGRGAHQKRALLIISDGQDNSSRYNFNEVRRIMKESDIVTYAVGIMDQHDAGNERSHQPEGVFALHFLPFEELRRHGSLSLAYSFNRRQQTSAKPDNRTCTGARPVPKTAPNATRLTVAARPGRHLAATGVRLPPMNLEPQKTTSEIRNHSGVARVLASITILALAALTILVVLEIIPRSAFTDMAGKTAMIAGICVVSVLAIGLLSKR